MDNKLEKVGLEILSGIEKELGDIKDDAKRKRTIRFILSILTSIPWVGGFFGALASKNSDREQSQINSLYELWFEEHERKMQELGNTINSILSRFDSLGSTINSRIESKEYLELVTKGFRIWDKSDTVNKKDFIKKLLANSAATTICSDDVVRLFLDWIEKYHESYFYVIKYIYENTGITRGDIWDRIYPSRPTEDSPEADLYKMLIRELSTGGVIRQHREVNYLGEFIKKKPKARSNSKKYLSAFDDVEPYELTKLGAQFVHYCMEDVVPQIEE